MATSSIKTNFVIRGAEQVEAFVSAFEASENTPTSARQVSDVNEIREIMKRRKRYNG